MKLRNTMTYAEMSRYMQRKTNLAPTKVNIGGYAKKMGYKVYKPTINKKLRFFYVRDKQDDRKTEEHKI